jgi:hypothetical protein
MFGILEAQKAGSLYDPGIGLALLRIRQVEDAGELDPFAVKIDFLGSQS